MTTKRKGKTMAADAKPAEKLTTVCIYDYGNKPPNFANATPEYLIDALGEIREMSKKCKKWEGWFKEAILGRRADFKAAINGEAYSGLLVDGEQVRIDSDAVREHFKDDPETLEKLMKVIPMVTIKTTRVG